MTRTAYLLFLSSCSTAIIHALIPDHWLPFVLMSRAERWSDRRAAALTGLAGSLHVLVTLLAGALTILVGSATVQDLARRTGDGSLPAPRVTLACPRWTDNLTVRATLAIPVRRANEADARHYSDGQVVRDG